MLALKLSAKAKQDLAAMAVHTRKTWGETQLKTYRQQLKSALTQLTTMPHMGRPRDDIREGYRSLPIGEHLIFYKIANDAVLIIAIPHAKRDTMHHLKG
ncbi:type II toxin-antitoxin system RelE/ParE family toxin [Terasakiella pusilla]|uniref:type II toxin-antitoxin system RelE/ParE family toxin n=1 Tax=Terasakiella pusilla TaxID=64973 RepID=UPI00048AD76E|nr:type II toxin-antitoxin system RelE/ParE family toxin [Terasakiella pusilla]